jgi:hypothetical protein
MSKESQPTVAATASNQDPKYDTSFRLLDFNIFDEKRENEEDLYGGPDNDDEDGHMKARIDSVEEGEKKFKKDQTN